jgi:cell division protein FtsL
MAVRRGVGHYNGLIGFILMQLLLLFAFLYQNNRYIAELYVLQGLEQQQRMLEKELELLTTRRAQVQDQTAIGRYAREQLHMEPIRLKSVHMLATLP